MAGERRQLIEQERAAARQEPPAPVSRRAARAERTATPERATRERGTRDRTASARTTSRRLPRWVAAVALGEALATVLLVAGVLPTPAETLAARASSEPPARSGPPRPAPTSQHSADVLHRAAAQALATGSVRFTFAHLWTDDTGWDVSLEGSGRADLRRGRLDYTQKVPGSAGAFATRDVLIDGRVWAGGLTGDEKGMWYTRRLTDTKEVTYTQDGYADPLEFLRMLTQVGADARPAGRRTVDGTDVTVYLAHADPRRKVDKRITGPGRPPGYLARSQKEDKIPALSLRVYLDAAGLPRRIVLRSRSGLKDHQKTYAVMTFSDWGKPQKVSRPTGRVYGYDAYFACLLGFGPC